MFVGKPSNVHCTGRQNRTAEDALWPSCKLCCIITVKFLQYLFFERRCYVSLFIFFLSLPFHFLGGWEGDFAGVSFLLFPLCFCWKVEPASFCTHVHSIRGLPMEEEVGTICPSDALEVHPWILFFSQGGESCLHCLSGKMQVIEMSVFCWF